MLVRARSIAASGLAALALVVTAGCGADGEDTDRTGADAAASSPGSPSVENSAEASTESSIEPSVEASPSSEEPTPAGSDTASAEPVAKAAGLRGKLLTADEVPGFNDEFTWTEKSTRRREGPAPFGTCQRYAMTSIGAMKVAVRTFRPAPGSEGPTAANLVAEFGDEMTATRAYEVLKSWRGQCEDQLKRYDRTRVGALQPVPVGGAVGGWYLLTYGPAGDPDTGYFDAQGITRVGDTISVVEMRLEGQDYNYPRGQEPMVGAVRHAATRIG